MRVDEFGCGLGVSEDRQSLFERLQVLNAHEHCCGGAVAGDDHAFAVSADTFDELGEPVLDGGQRLIHHEHDFADVSRTCVHLVGLGRFELPTFGPPDRRANQTAPQPVTGLRLAAAAPGARPRLGVSVKIGRRAAPAVTAAEPRSPGPPRLPQPAASSPRRSQQQGDALDGSPAQVGHGQRQQYPKVPGDPGGSDRGPGGAGERPRVHRLAARRAGTIGAHRAGGQVALAGRTPGHNRQAKSTPVPTPGLGPRCLRGPLTRNDPAAPAPMSPLVRRFGARESAHPNDPVRSGSVSPLVRVLSGLICFRVLRMIQRNFQKFQKKSR